MKDARSGGALVTTIAGLILLMVAGGWLTWGRGAWNRYQIRSLLRDALEAYRGEQEGRGYELLKRAEERATLSTLPPGVEQDLFRAILALRVRRAYEEQMARDTQEVTIGRVPREIMALRDLRNEGRRLRLPCPAVVELLGAYADTRILR